VICAPDAIGDELCFEAVDEALAQRVVIRIADRSNRSEQVVVVEDLGEGVAGVLAAGVGVVDQLDIRVVVTTGQRHPQRVEHEVGAHVGRELPADDAPAEHVDDEAEEHHSLVATQVGEVGDPTTHQAGRR
jgi:hypothetical protein